MNKLSTVNYLSFILLCCLVSISCDTNQAKLKTTAKENMDAQTETLINMESAYKGEMTATAKYEAFSKKAEEEGYHKIALLYNAVSAAENIHAINYKAVIEDAGREVPIVVPKFILKSTMENLKDDVNGEAYEAKSTYPEFLKTAEKAGNQTACLSLTYAMKTELKHKYLFEQALGDINANTLASLPGQYFVCPACGNTYSHLPKHCDFSLTEGEKFIVFQ